MINQKYIISKFQKHLSLNLHMLKEIIEESKIIKIIEENICFMEKGRYNELRCESLDEFIKKFLIIIEKIEFNLDEFMLKKGFCSKIYNYLFNDIFGSINQL